MFNVLWNFPIAPLLIRSTCISAIYPNRCIKPSRFRATIQPPFRALPGMPKAAVATRSKSRSDLACSDCRQRKTKCIKIDEKTCERCQAHGWECKQEKDDGRRPIPRQMYVAVENSYYRLQDETERVKAQQQHTEIENQVLSARVKQLEATLQQNGILIPPHLPQSADILPDSGWHVGGETPELAVQSSMPNISPATVTSSSAHKKRLRAETDIEELAVGFGKLNVEDGAWYGGFSPFLLGKTLTRQDSEELPACETISTPQYRLHTSEGHQGIRDPCDHSRYLPQLLRISRFEHDVLLDRFFKFFAFWGMKTVQYFMLRDMYAALSAPSAPGSNPSIRRLPTFNYYSVPLHLAVVGMALIFSDDPARRDVKTRMIFVKAALAHLEDAGHRPCLASVQAYGILASIFAGLGRQGQGFTYFGRSLRMGQELGLHINLSAHVQTGRMSKETQTEREWAYWSCFMHDTCWAAYVDRGCSMPFEKHRIPLPQIDPAVDNMIVEWPAKTASITTAESNKGTAAQKNTRVIPARREPCYSSTSFVFGRDLFAILAESGFDIMHGAFDSPQLRSDAICRIRVELAGWYDRLPEPLQLPARISATTVASPNVLMIHMAFYWVMILVHQPLFRTNRDLSNPPGLMLASTLSINHSANPTQHCTPDPDTLALCKQNVTRILEITRVWKALYELRFCPINFISIIVTAGITASLMMRVLSKSKKAFEEAWKLGKACVGHLEEIGQVWEVAKQQAAGLQDLLNEHDNVINKNERRRKRQKGAGGEAGISVNPHEFEFEEPTPEASPSGSGTIKDLTSLQPPYGSMAVPSQHPPLLVMLSGPGGIQGMTGPPTEFTAYLPQFVDNPHKPPVRANTHYQNYYNHSQTLSTVGSSKLPSTRKPGCEVGSENSGDPDCLLLERPLGLQPPDGFKDLERRYEQRGKPNEVGASMEGTNSHIDSICSSY